MKWWKRSVMVVAAIYPLSLLAAVLALHYVGERWWLTGVALYMPRLFLAGPLPLVVVAIGFSRLHRMLWTQAVAALLLLFPLMGFAPPRLLPQPRERRVLRVLSYNVDSGVGGIERIVDEINARSPDVVLLQEVGSSEPLSTLLGAHYPIVRATDQFFLASRYPVS